MSQFIQAGSSAKYMAKNVQNWLPNMDVNSMYERLFKMPTIINSKTNVHASLVVQRGYKGCNLYLTNWCQTFCHSLHYNVLSIWNTKAALLMFMYLNGLDVEQHNTWFTNVRSNSVSNLLPWVWSPPTWVVPGGADVAVRYISVTSRQTAHAND